MLSMKNGAFYGALLLCLCVTSGALADGTTIHKLNWHHFDGTNAADATLKLDGTNLGKGQTAIDALYAKIAGMNRGDQINVHQGVQTNQQGIRQFPFNLSKLIQIAQQHGVIVNVPAIDAP